MSALELDGAGGIRVGKQKGICLRLPQPVAKGCLAFGALAVFFIGFGIGFACAPAREIARATNPKMR